MDKLTIILVEDDTSTCARFNTYINSLDEVILLNFTNNASQALTLISHYKPDVIILDLELHNGIGNGFDVLSGLSKYKSKPYIIVTTNNSSQTTYEYSRHLGADFIMYKHQQDYSEEKVIDFLISMKNIIKQNNVQLENADTKDMDIANKRIIQLISNELDLIGISRRSVGFNYLVEGIYMSLDGPIPKLCEQIAKKYKKSEPSVERAMQSAINRAWNSTDIETLLKYYTAYVPTHTSSPSLTQFINYYVDRINYVK